MSSKSTPVFDRSLFIPSALAGAALGGVTSWAIISGLPNVSGLVSGKHHRLIWPGMFVGALGYAQYAKSKQARLAKQNSE